VTLTVLVVLAMICSVCSVCSTAPVGAARGCRRPGCFLLLAIAAGWTR
jgi:hypothetical protein